MKTRVVLVDDHAAIRQMLAVVLEREGCYEVCGEAGTGFEALKVVRQTRPRVVILDLQLPELSGIEVARKLREEGDTRVLVFSGALSRELWIEALRVRPHGLVHKEDSLQTLRDGLRTVAGGGGYFTRFATELMDEARQVESNWSRLSERERAVLQMIAEGMGNKQMASCLGIATKTVEHYRAQLMDKLGLHDVARLTRYAVAHGVVPVDT